MLGASSALSFLRSRFAAARAELVIILFLLTAVGAFIWNGSALLQLVAADRAPRFSAEVQVAAAALVLNVALILFGWRRYADLQHERELRVDGERRAALQAATDSITGLANRKGFADGVDRLCREQLDPSTSLVIISLQIQRFKRINDHHGYDLGDALLREMASAMRAQVPAHAVVARLSGDEFAIAACFAAKETNRAEQLAEALLRDVSRTYDIQGAFVQVGAFAGIASAAPGVPCRASDLLRRADIALDHARSARAARPTWFDSPMEKALIQRGELEQAIRIGIEHDQFIPFFEPQVDLASGEITGFEMLARWQHPNRGLLGAEVFIPVAEEIGLIGALSEKVIAQALGTARSWDPAISLSVNISPAQLSDPWLAQRLLRLLVEHSFPAERLVVEVTESSLFSDLDLARSTVLSLKNQGVKLALDDFGTGYSSLSHLRLLPLDAIKIDRSFVSSANADKESAAIVRAVTTLAQALSVPVTAEGLEDAATLERMLALGARTGQGWFLGKPMTAEAVAELLARRSLDSDSRRQAS
jgi:diguanylate cyclase (GGDEF)-like protein